MSVDKALNQYEVTKSEHLEELKKLVRIPSVSFDGFDPAVVVRSAEAVADLLKRSGLENVEILQPLPGVHPYVYADWLHAPGKPTILLYAHHDVQPPGRIEKWKSPPFEPTERNGRLFGRGTADDKAGIVVHTAAITSWLKSTGKLPVNVKLIIEGEEEAGSTHLPEFLKMYSKKLQADAMVLTDTQNYDVGWPALTTSLRGLITFDVELKLLDSPKHSGMWGGPTPDVAMALSKMLASLTDEQNRIIVPGVLNDVRAVNAAEKRAYDELPMSVAEFRAQAGLLSGAHTLPANDGTFKPLIQMWREPSFAINAIEVSKRAMASNSIMDSAWVRIGLRIVADMNPEKTAKLVEDYLRAKTPWGCEVDIKTDIGGPAWGTDAFSAKNKKTFEAGMKALELGYGKKPVLMGCGGSIPFVEPLSTALGGVPALLIGVEDPYTNAHSENESMVIADFESCIKSAIHFYSLYAT